MYTAERYHDISCGHRVMGHEGKCRYLHGHNYRIHFVCVSEDKNLDDVGRVVDFGVIKSALCIWLEREWDHKFLLHEDDPMVTALRNANPISTISLVTVPFNPTAEEIAKYLVEVVGPERLAGTGVVLHSVRVEETRKCSATYTRSTR